MNTDTYDRMLCSSWNASSFESNTLRNESFWELCRLFEGQNLLESNSTAVSTISIGPFKLASDLSVDIKDFLVFFAETIIPLAASKTNFSSFEDCWQYVLLPATHICLNLMSKTCLVNEKYLWEVLLYIKSANAEGNYPSKEEITSSLSFMSADESKATESLEKLMSYKSLLDSDVSLIEREANGYKSNV